MIEDRSNPRHTKKNVDGRHGYNEGLKEQTDTSPKGTQSHKEQKGTLPEGPKGHKGPKDTPLKAQNAKMEAPIQVATCKEQILMCHTKNCY